MLHLDLVLCLVGLTMGSPPAAKTREEIDAFREYLEKSREDNVYRLDSRVLSDLKSNVWENSGKFEGDILLEDWQIEGLVTDFATGRNAYIWPNTKWPRNLVFYEFGKNEFNSQQRAAITDAISSIERNSCVRFRRRGKESNYVLITGRSNGCYAVVGFSGNRGVHTLNLARSNPGQGCLQSTVIVHEWLHVLGFFHMQSTHNRDDFVRIESQNIQDGAANNFNKYGNNMVSNLGIPYEYTSCMHYSSHAFSKNGQPTIVPLKSFVGAMGQRKQVTNNDWLRLRRHYNCPGAWNRDSLEYSDEQPSAAEPEEISPVILADNSI